DTFDAFRNLYLALESLLDTVRPVQTKPNGRRESEGEWLSRWTRVFGARAVRLTVLQAVPLSAMLQEPMAAYLEAALATVAATLDLRPFALPGAGAPQSRIFTEIYKGCRNPVFHAKSSGNPLLPGEYSDRAAVASSVRRITGFYIAL